MSTPVRDQPPREAAEELLLGSPPRLPRWSSPAIIGLGLVIVAAAVIWNFWPRPIAPLSLAELQDTYAGMVRSDGMNEASVMTRQAIQEAPITFSPAACGPLMEMVVANRLPAASIDGVGTFWLLTRDSTVSLFTLRFPDDDSATAEELRIMSALDDCAGQQMFGRSVDEPGIRTWETTIERSPPGTTDSEQLGYLLRGSDSVLTVRLMPYLNTLTWQYRYQSGSAGDGTVAADQLMTSLHLQLDAIVEARSR